jgi:hypothetical protein
MNNKDEKLEDQKELDPEPKDPRFFWLTVGQYTLLFIVTIIFVGVLAFGIKDIERLKDIEIAMGLITFLVAVATIAVATIMVITAIISGKDFDKRFALGKEVLTLMIGVLGTIIGFYFGAAKPGQANADSLRARAAQVAPVKITPEQPQSGGVVNLVTKLTGGLPPYTYSIRFPPNTIQTIENQTSENGEIKHEFKVNAPSGSEIVFRIEGADKNGTPFVYLNPPKNTPSIAPAWMEMNLASWALRPRLMSAIIRSVL